MADNLTRQEAIDLADHWKQIAAAECSRNEILEWKLETAIQAIQSQSPLDLTLPPDLTQRVDRRWKSTVGACTCSCHRRIQSRDCCTGRHCTRCHLRHHTTEVETEGIY